MISLNLYFKVLGGICLVLVCYYLYIDNVVRRNISHEIKKVYNDDFRDLREFNSKN